MSTVKVSIFTAGYCTCPEHIALRGGRWEIIRFPAMFALFEHQRYGAMLYDTGYSYRFFDETQRMPNRLYRMLTPVTLREEQLAVNQLAARSLRASDISKVFISHFHADHIAALRDFPRARFVFLPQAYDAVKQLHGWRAVSHAYLPGLIPSDFSERMNPLSASILKPLPPEFRPFTAGFDLLGDESLLAVELPGHATGQMGLIARGDDGAIYFFVADAVWLKQGITENLPPHRITNLLFPDPSAYRSTLSDLQTLQLKCPAVRIIPSHCAETLRQAASPAMMAD